MVENENCPVAATLELIGNNAVTGDLTMQEGSTLLFDGGEHHLFQSAFSITKGAVGM